MLVVDAATSLTDQLPQPAGAASGDYATIVASAEATVRKLSGVAKPLAIILDDLPTHHPSTQAVVGRLQRERIGAPILWVLTVETGDPRFSNGALDFDVIEMGALTESDVADLAESTLGRPITRAERERILAGGRLPVHVHSALTALASEPDAGDVGGVWPESVVASTGEPVRSVLAAAAVLGSHFAASDLAGIIDRPVAVLIGPLRSAILSGALNETADAFAFPHRLVQQAFKETLGNEDLRRLSERATDLRIHRGDPPELVVAATIDSIDIDSLAGINRLKAAIEVVKARNIGLAAELEARLLTSPHLTVEDRMRVVTSLMSHLAQSGDLASARHLLQQYAEGGDAEFWLAASKVEFAFSFDASHAHAAEGLRHVTPGSAGEARLISMRHLAGMLGGAELVTPGQVKAAEALAAQCDDGRARALANINQGILLFGSFDWNAALRRASLASDQRLERLDSGEWWFAAILRANLLRALGRRSEAEAFVDDQAGRAESRGQLLAVTLFSLVRASLALDAGRLQEAHIHATVAISLSEQFGDRRIALVDAASVFIRIARHKGDLRAVEEWRDELRRLAPDAHRQPVVAELLLIAADTLGTATPDASLGVEPESMDEALSVPSITRDLGDDVLRVRLLVSRGWAESVDKHLGSAATRAARTGSLLARAVNSHIVGIVRGDSDRLREAIAGYRYLERDLLVATALEDLAQVGGVPQKEARQALQTALRAWEDHGADHDAARLVARLRTAGVRNASRYTSAAPGLTAAETRVVEELLKGQSTAQIAAVLFISPNTVSVHLRRIYAKAGVRSRAELIGQLGGA